MAMRIRRRLEIMDILSMQQQAAFDRLYRWVQDYSTTLALPSPDVHPLMPLAIRALRDRHVLYTYCLTAVENARSKALVRNFLDALVKGGPKYVVSCRAAALVIEQSGP